VEGKYQFYHHLYFVKKPYIVYSLTFICFLVEYYQQSYKKGTKMTGRKKAERVFRRLSVENRGLLLTYFETALEAENSVKKSLDLAMRTGRGKGKGKLRRSREGEGCAALPQGGGCAPGGAKGEG
jgi:hypothetical protein